MIKTKQFGLQLDDSTFPGNKPLLLGYVRFFKDSKVVQGESVFSTVGQYLNEERNSNKKYYRLCD